MVQNPNDTKDHHDEAEVRDVESDIKESMGNGKKHFLCSDYPAAIACFQEACSLLSDKYGQMAQECSDAYYYYGVSLLEMARLENGVLGNALKGVPDGIDSDEEVEQFEKPDLEEKERLELRETVEAAMATEEEDESDEDKSSENGDPGDQKQEEPAKPSEGESNKDAESSEQTSKDEEPVKSESKKDDESAGTKDSTVESEEPSSSNVDAKKSGDEEMEDADEIPNMQLAWEMLELAKILFLKREKSEDNSLMVAQCHLKLGELGLEVENYSQSIGDFLECLLLQKEVLSNTDRKLAETHYNLGLAYTFAKQYDNAIEHYKTSLEVLENRVKYLEGVIDNKANDDKDESMTECKEVGEIKELIPDIYSKIEDVIHLRGEKPSIRSFSPNVESGETTIGFGNEAQSSSSSCSVIPVKKSSSSTSKESTCDITHLVRRKRTSPDDSAPEDGSGDSKKVKHETAVITGDESKDPETDMVQDTDPPGKISDANEAKSVLEASKEVSTCADSEKVDAPKEASDTQ